MHRPLPEPPDTPDLHGFVMVGKKALYLCHLPMFYVENHCYQVILRAELSEADYRTYLKVRSENPTRPLILGNHVEETLDELVNQGTFLADAFVGMPDDDSTPFMTPMVRITQTLRFTHFDPEARYPDHLTYFLFGTAGEAHLSHVITKAPNFQQVLDLADVPAGVTPKQLEQMLQITIPSLSMADGAPIESDPLVEESYEAETEDGAALTIDIGRKHWFDVDMLNEISDGEVDEGLQSEQA